MNCRAYPVNSIPCSDKPRVYECELHVFFAVLAMWAPLEALPSRSSLQPRRAKVNLKRRAVCQRARSARRKLWGSISIAPSRRKWRALVKDDKDVRGLSWVHHFSIWFILIIYIEHELIEQNYLYY